MTEEREITESYLNKNYEYKLTEMFFQTIEALKFAERFPIDNNLKNAFTEFKGFAYSQILSRHHLQEFPLIRDAMNEIGAILYGDPTDPTVINLKSKYRVRVEKNRFGETKIMNAQNLTQALFELMNIMKQWGYEMGLYLTKPYSHKLGTDALKDALDQ